MRNGMLLKVLIGGASTVLAVGIVGVVTTFSGHANEDDLEAQKKTCDTREKASQEGDKDLQQAVTSIDKHVAGIDASLRILVDGYRKTN